MENLLSPNTAQRIVERIEALRPNAQPLWGKMNVAQMLAHCQVGFQTYFGEKKIKRSLIGVLFGGMVKKKMLTEKPWSHNLPTAKEFIVADNRDFEREKSSLVQQIQRFVSSAKTVTPEVHPFFGKMSVEEWGRLAYKHTDHHLQQFGV